MKQNLVITITVTNIPAGADVALAQKILSDKLGGITEEQFDLEANVQFHSEIVNHDTVNV